MIVEQQSVDILDMPVIFVTAGSNPNNDSPCLEVEFDRFGQPVSFPQDSQIEEYAATLEQVRGQRVGIIM